MVNVGIYTWILWGIYCLVYITNSRWLIRIRVPCQVGEKNIFVETKLVVFCNPIYRSPWCSAKFAWLKMEEKRWSSFNECNMFPIDLWGKNFLSHKEISEFSGSIVGFSTLLNTFQCHGPVKRLSQLNFWIFIPFACRKRWQMVLEGPIPCLMDENFVTLQDEGNCGTCNE